MNAAPADIIELAHDTLVITELTPADGGFVGKRIRRDGTITQYPNVAQWHQNIARIPATIPALADYLEQARRRNICLIRGAPADLSREKTRRQIAGGTRGDHGFLDEPTKLFFFDIDGAAGHWRDDPEAAVQRIVAQLGEPWASASFVWFFSAGHGLAMETVEAGNKKLKVWRGEIADNKIRVRLAFILDRELTWREAASLTAIVRATSGLPLDEAICRTVQPNYIARPLWDGHPNLDVLGDIPTIGWVGGGCDITTVTTTAAGIASTTITATVAVPPDLAHKARWAAAEGHGIVIADHPDAVTAVRAIGSDGRIRQHMMAAIAHLLKANPPRDHVSSFDHGLALADQLRVMIEQHREWIEVELARHGRSPGDLSGYLDGMGDWGRWLIERPGAFARKTIKLTQEPAAEQIPPHPAQAIFDQVARTFAEFYELRLSLFDVNDDNRAMLLIAPTGSRKSTLMRATAVKLVTEHRDHSSDQCVVILVPRHELGAEQVRALHREHPDVDFTAAVWRGRQREDADFIGPQQPGKARLMCWRATEAKGLEDVLLDVETHLCKRGRGAGAVRCPFYFHCGAQRQKRQRADIWFAAHELMAHPPPKAFGHIARVMIDESPLDAFLYGVDITDEITLELGELLSPPARGFNGEITLMCGREALHEALSEMRLPASPHHGAPISLKDLENFASRPIEGRQEDFIFASIFGDAPHNPALLAALEWKDKVDPTIRPDMPAKQVREQLAFALGNARIRKLVMLWTLLADDKPGRLQLHNSERGRIVRMVGMRMPAEGWQVPTLICDATGDPHLLRHIWPNLTCEVEEWQQLPRPPGVRIVQCVDRAVSKHAVAIEGENEELKRREAAARRLYAAILAQALAYGGQNVGVIVYKSTRTWIEAHCFVPSWLRLFHHGSLTGTNILEDVRALFVVGRPLASAEAVTRMAEALTGDHIAERGYRSVKKGGRIPIAPDAKGNNAVLVDTWALDHPVAERLRRQITEGSLLQADGRGRTGQRDASRPLDIHRWHDVPLGELGPVEPVLWDEVAVRLDGLMLATGGVWLENVAHAGKAYSELFSANTLKQARRRAQTQAGLGGADVAGARSRYIPYYKTLIGNVPTPLIGYQLAGGGQKPAWACSLLGLAETRAWLESKLGPLIMFKAIDDPGLEQAAQ